MNRNNAYDDEGTQSYCCQNSWIDVETDAMDFQSEIIAAVAQKQLAKFIKQQLKDPADASRFARNLLIAAMAMSADEVEATKA